MKYALTAIFVVLIGVFLYLLADSINRPVNFHNTWAARKTVIYKQLEEIVELQKMYKVLHNDTSYCGNFDDMLQTFLSDSFNIFRIEGDPYDTLKKPDTVRVKLASRDSLGSFLVKKGFIKSETLTPLISKAKTVYDTDKDNAKNHPDVIALQQFLEKSIKEYITKIKTVPFSENKSANVAVQEFDIEASKIALEGSKMASLQTSPTFEVSTTVGTYMPEFLTDEYSMYDPGFDPNKIIKVGDLTKVTTAGNW